jgi:tetratricopeptide (TPR) repeat protein
VSRLFQISFLIFFLKEFFFLSSAFGVISQDIYKGDRWDSIGELNPEIIRKDIQKTPLFEDKSPKPFKRIRLDGLTIEELKSHLKKNPNNITLLKYLGMAYSKARKNLKAKETYETILKLAPDEWKVQRKLGDTYYYLQQYLQAIQAYQKTLKFQPEDISTHSNLGTTFFRINKVENAAKHFKKVLENNPDHLITLNNLGLLYLRIGKAKESIPLLKRANEIDPAHLQRYLQLGKAYEKVGDYIKAERLYFEILKKDSNFVDAYNSLADFYLKQLNQPGNSIKYYKKSLSTAPNQSRHVEIRSILKKLESQTD